MGPIQNNGDLSYSTRLRELLKTLVEYTSIHSHIPKKYWLWI